MRAPGDPGLIKSMLYSAVLNDPRGSSEPLTSALPDSGSGLLVPLEAWVSYGRAGGWAGPLPMGPRGLRVTCMD